MCGVGISLTSSSWPCQLLGWYLATLAVFHWSEFYATAVTNPKHLVLDSFILNHSSAYHVAVVSSFVEFFVEYYFFPGTSLRNCYSSTVFRTVWIFNYQFSSNLSLTCSSTCTVIYLIKRHCYVKGKSLHKACVQSAIQSQTTSQSY